MKIVGAFGGDLHQLMPTAANDSVAFILAVEQSRIRFDPMRFEAMAFQDGAFARKVFTGSAILTGLLVAFASNAVAEKLVDPNAVAPEYRAAAEKRRAEQLKLFQCSKKADDAKVLRRDRAAYVSECLEK